MLTKVTEKKEKCENLNLICLQVTLVVQCFVHSCNCICKSAVGYNISLKIQALGNGVSLSTRRYIIAIHKIIFVSFCKYSIFRLKLKHYIYFFSHTFFVFLYSSLSPFNIRFPYSRSIFMITCHFFSSLNRSF